MNKIIIALGLTLAAATGAFAQSNNDYVELASPTHGPAAEAHAAKSDMAKTVLDAHIAYMTSIGLLK